MILYVCRNCWHLFSHSQIHNAATDECQKCHKGTCVETGEPTIPPPSIGVELDCIVCAKMKPWGMISQSTGVSVCIDCRDKARAIINVKPNTIIINNIEVPEPLREAPAATTPVYMAEANPYGRGSVYYFKWEGGATEQYYLDCGILHLTEDAARQHWNAIISGSKKG